MAASARSQPPGGFLEHHFGRSPADGQDPGIAPKPLDRRFSNIADAAVALLARVGDVVREFAGERFQLGYLADALALLDARTNAWRERTCASASDSAQCALPSAIAASASRSR